MHLLFDFDGTLANSFDCVIDKANLLAERFSFRKIAAQEKETLRNLSSMEVMQFLKVPKYKIPTLIFHMRKELRTAMLDIKPFEALKPILETLYHDQHVMGILTSNSLDNVTAWLNNNHMQHLFQFIHGEATFFTKRHLIKRTLSKYKIDKAEVLYIGDETRDIDAASKNNIKTVAVTWGYNSEETLLKSNPSFVIRNPKDLLDVINHQQMKH